MLITDNSVQQKVYFFIGIVVAYRCAVVLVQYTLLSIGCRVFSCRLSSLVRGNIAK